MGSFLADRSAHIHSRRLASLDPGRRGGRRNITGDPGTTPAQRELGRTRRTEGAYLPAAPPWAFERYFRKPMVVSIDCPVVGMATLNVNVAVESFVKAFVEAL